MIKTWILIALLALVGPVLLTGCSDDDDATTPENFRFTLTVVDTSGDPVPDVNLIILPDLPYYQDGKTGGSRAAVHIPFETEDIYDVDLVIEDLEGAAVMTWSEENVSAGSHAWIWNGRDDGDDPVHSGVYFARIVLRDTSSAEVVFDQREGMLMARMDFDDETMGTTGDNGQIVLTDPRFFPHELAAEDQIARDENGDALGAIEFNGQMRFYLGRTGEGSLYHVRQVQGLRNLELVWDPSGKSRAIEASVPVNRPHQDRVPPLVNRLRPPNPNPFN